MKDTLHGFKETDDLKLLDRAMRALFSDSPDKDTEESLKLLNARIDTMQRNSRKSFLKQWAYPVAAALAIVISTVAVTVSVTYDDSLQRYANNGETAVMVGLPDGTQAWLNPGTELTFGHSFNTDDRNVSLSGEAYFDVAHNPDCPFIVTTESFRIKVLGTVFNVRNFPGDARPEVSLAQGSVAMQNLDGVNLVRLRPG